MEFAEYLAEHAPEVAALSDLKRRHIEAYKRILATYPTHRARYPCVPVHRVPEVGPPAYGVRLPGRDRGRGRASGPAHSARRPADPGSAAATVIDDGAAAKLLQAARADPDPFVRLAVEFLARTGLRLGEFMDLTTDAVVQIGSAYWLRGPIGKLHNDRYIPLHPQLKAMLDEWLADRPPELRTNYVFMHHGRRISRAWVRKGLYRVAMAAGIGRVTPHQLRHTLATQAINRGMTLEALAAGSPAMETPLITRI